MILKITDSKGNTVEEYKDIATQVIDPQFPRLINDILTDVEERSGLFSSSLPLTVFSGHEVAMKTGTTNDYRDAWTIGYTPTLAVGVWAGNNNNEAMQKHGSSILAAVPIWNAFMKEALKTQPSISFNKPNPVLNQKAMLRGEYTANYKIGAKIYPHIHDILYYVDKNNPQGPQPSNPEKDSQFYNWEEPTLKWAKENIPNFTRITIIPPDRSAIRDRNKNFQTANKHTLAKNGDFIKMNAISVPSKYNRTI